MKRSIRNGWRGGAVAPALLLAVGCQGLGKITEGVTSIAVATGTVSQEQADSINKSAQAVEKTFADITPEQEYYIGRAVIATVLQTYKPLDARKANDYLNRLGQALAMASDRPETFGGYRFLLLDSDDINAFAAPGGLVVITRGMFNLCASEDELAAVLAHEVAHAQLSHGLRAIKTSRLTSALTTLAVEAGKNLGGQQLSEVTRAFEGSIGDITQTMMNSGYARSAEYQADAAAVTILGRVGYDPQGLVRMLEEMKRRLKPGGLDFAKTHPDPNDRIARVRRLMAAPVAAAAPDARQRRFAAARGALD